MTENKLFKKICDKESMLLEYSKDTNIYSLNFSINNTKNKDIKNILSSNIYILLKDINPEIIDNVIIINYNDNDNLILFILKEIGILKQKYMILKNTKKVNNNIIQFNTVSITKDELINQYFINDEIKNIINKLDEVKCEFANLQIDYFDNEKINICYLFKIILNDDLPIYMENIIGLLMKKIFYNLKLYIEN